MVTSATAGQIDEGVTACFGQHVLRTNGVDCHFLGNYTASELLHTNQRFQELALLSDRMFPEETDKIERYVGGMPDLIYSSVVASKPNGNNCPQWKNKNQGNGSGVARAYAVGVAGQNPDNNVVTGTFLLNNRCASILFDTGADRSFVSTQFSALINIAPTTLDHGYNVELADGRIIWVNTVLLGCTLNFLNHPFHVDLMPVEMGTYDVIIGMDWLTKYQAIIDCAKKIVRIPFGSEILIFHGDGSRNKRGTRLNIISCTKAQKYVLQGCHIPRNPLRIQRILLCCYSKPSWERKRRMLNDPENPKMEFNALKESKLDRSRCRKKLYNSSYNRPASRRQNEDGISLFKTSNVNEDFEQFGFSDCQDSKNTYEDPFYKSALQQRCRCMCLVQDSKSIQEFTSS
ncbi:putative reverse transcriptase domain-containing protein [Tanacetum coccineum]|uniref:Reverse transcriptase domain-containing protein n=1 Tax=Tanacetum coccineum TaxID=301880 RepID=A0ABQ5EQS0_9ASTR